MKHSESWLLLMAYKRFGLMQGSLIPRHYGVQYCVHSVNELEAYSPSCLRAKESTLESGFPFQ